MAATKPKASIRVHGVTYTNPDEARVAADDREHQVDELAADLRARGRDGEADQVQDRGHADAATLRAWARDREADEAGDTEQPDDRPTEPARPRRRRARRPSVTPRTRSVVGATGGAGGAALQATGIPQSTSSLLLQAAGLTILVAFLTLAVTARGSSAFAGLAGAGANGLSWFISPTDPLAPHNPAASQTAASYARSGAATRRATAKTGRK